MNDHAFSPKEMELLEERARILAAASDEADVRPAELTAAIVRVGDEQFGLSSSDVREIIRCPRIAQLPGVPSWCRGLAQIRGEVLTVVDLVALLGIGRAKTGRFLAVVCAAKRAAGILADDVVGLRDIYADDLAGGLQRGPGVALRPIHATTRDYVSILDVPRLLDQVLLQQDRGRPADENEHRPVR